MYNYRKRFFYPIHVERLDPNLAKLLLEHYGGKDGELTQVLQYLNHQANMSNRFLKELLGLIAAEELAHLETFATVISKLSNQPSSYVSSKGQNWDIGNVNQDVDQEAMLKADIALEIRSRVLLEKQLSRTTDPGVKRLLNFLARREGIHQNLLKRSLKILTEGGSSEQYMEIIYDYKMSLQVLD